MMKKMLKPEYLIALLLSVGIFTSCADMFSDRYLAPSEETPDLGRIQTPSGAYLAGRVAHMRQDLDKAALFYSQAVDLGVEQPDVLGRAYLLSALGGDVDRAHKYAKQAQESGDKNYMIRFINMSYDVHHGDYTQAESDLSDISDKGYQNKLLPPFRAWILAGMGDRQKALDALKPLEKDKNLKSIYYMHVGMINDYFGQDDEARKAYETILKNEDLELSFRSLQVIGNFAARHDQKAEILNLIKVYSDKNNKPMMLTSLFQQIENMQTSPEKLVDTPAKGVAETLFNMGTAFRTTQSEVAQIFTALALYLNPNHDVARVSVADLAENARQFEQARASYALVSKDSPIYFMAQFKIASIYTQERQDAKALEKFRELNEMFPNNYQVLFQLGEVSRVMDRQTDAIRYYHQAIAVVPEDMPLDWMLLYALGISYERNDEWQRAEDVFQKALILSNRHPLVLNYLGYSWLKHNKNPNEALYMIFEAYRQNPEDAYIMDSLGWALFRMGKYTDSVKVLERAAEYLPDNAVICDHLGDAYWQTGRLEEARYQWKHALTLKDDFNEVDPDIVRRKIKNGMQKVSVIPFNENLLVERLKGLSLD
jgi:tetratricopeptide (TPR) repeat protein